MSHWKVRCTYSTSASVMNSAGQTTVIVEAHNEHFAQHAAISAVYAAEERGEIDFVAHVRPGRPELLS